ncbi:MAG TPA: cation-transporting P-type ATPase, partial [Anaerolineales bacterium]|nr:cation-transporting P-type ATPase [Anaerolineales bacterium]
MPSQLTPPASYWNTPSEKLLASLQSSPDGLTTNEAQRRLKEVGPNVLKVGRRLTAFSLLLAQFKSPLVLILLFAVAVSAYVQEWVDA